MQRFLRYLGLRARPFLRPDWEEERRALAEIRSRLDQLDGMRELTSRQASELSRLGTRVDRIADREVTRLRKAMTDLRRAVLGQTHVTARALRRATFRDEQARLEEAVQRVVNRTLRTGRPAIAGPWTGEIGFELLYWIPFLRKLKTRLGDVPLTVMSRGGTAAWYDGIATQYVDVFTLVDLEEFQRETDRETRKQRFVGTFDRRLVRRASQMLGLTLPIVVHPSLMYNLLYSYWKDQLGVRQLFEYLETGPLTGAPAVGVELDLPDRYVAVRFYFSKSLPDTPANRTLVDEVVGGISAQIPVVLLNTPFSVDDHVDIAPAAQVRSIAPLLTPENNLALQTAVIRRARAFVGTYGGFSYLAPLYGVPSMTFYSEAAFFEQHLEFARRTFSRVGAPPFIVLDTRERALVSEFLAPGYVNRNG